MTLLMHRPLERCVLAPFTRQRSADSEVHRLRSWASNRPLWKQTVAMHQSRMLASPVVLVSLQKDRIIFAHLIEAWFELPAGSSGKALSPNLGISRCWWSVRRLEFNVSSIQSSEKGLDLAIILAVLPTIITCKFLSSQHSSSVHHFSLSLVCQRA
jgi:hypothetical protein